MRTTRTTIYRRPTAARWLCLLLVLLGGVISKADAQTRDIITFTGGHADPDRPGVYVIDAGSDDVIVDPDGGNDKIRIRLSRPYATQDSHEASILINNLNQPWDEGTTVTFAPGETEKTVDIETYKYAFEFYNGNAPAVFSVLSTKHAEAEYDVVIYNINHTATEEPQECNLATPLEVLQSVDINYREIHCFRWGKYMLLSFDLGKEMIISDKSRLVIQKRYVDHTNLALDADDYGLSKTQNVVLKPINAGATSNIALYLYRPSDDEYMRSYRDDGIYNGMVIDNSVHSEGDPKAVLVGIKEMGPFVVANPGDDAMTSLFFSEEDMKDTYFLLHYPIESFIPKFSNVTLDKTSYKSGETMVITATMDNWKLIKRARQADFKNSFGVTFDGLNIVEPLRYDFDETTGQVTYAVPAPDVNGSVNVDFGGIESILLYYDFETGDFERANMVMPGNKGSFSVDVTEGTMASIASTAVYFTDLPADGSLIELPRTKLSDGNFEVNDTEIRFAAFCMPFNSNDGKQITYFVTGTGGAEPFLTNAQGEPYDNVGNPCLHTGTKSGTITVTARLNDQISTSRTYTLRKAPGMVANRNNTYIVGTTFPKFQFQLEGWDEWTADEDDDDNSEGAVTVNFTHANGTTWTEHYKLSDLKKQQHESITSAILYDLPFSFTEEHPDVDDEQIGQPIITAQVLVNMDNHGEKAIAEATAMLTPDLKPIGWDDLSYQEIYYHDAKPAIVTTEVSHLPRKGFSVGYRVQDWGIEEIYNSQSGEPLPSWLTLEEEGEYYYTAHINAVIDPTGHEVGEVSYYSYSAPCVFYTLAQRSCIPDEVMGLQLTRICYFNKLLTERTLVYQVNGENVTGDLTFDNTQDIQNILNTIKTKGFYQDTFETKEEYHSPLSEYVDVEYEGVLNPKEEITLAVDPLNLPKAFFYVDDIAFGGADVTLSCEDEVIQTLTKHKGNFFFQAPCDGRTYKIKVDFPGYNKTYTTTFVSSELPNLYHINSGIGYYDTSSPVTLKHFVDGEPVTITYPMYNPNPAYPYYYQHRLQGIVYMQNPSKCYLSGNFGGRTLRLSLDNYLIKLQRDIKPELRFSTNSWFDEYGFSPNSEVGYNPKTVEYMTVSPYKDVNKHYFWGRHDPCFYHKSWIDPEELRKNDIQVTVVNSLGQPITDATINFACVDSLMVNQGPRGSATYDNVLGCYLVPTDGGQFAQLLEVVPASGSYYKPMLSTLYLWNYDPNDVGNLGRPRRHTIVLDMEDRQVKSLALETPKREKYVNYENMDATIAADDLLMMSEYETLNYSPTADDEKVTKHIYDGQFGPEGWHGMKYIHLTGMMTYQGTLDPTQLQLEGMAQQPTLTTKQLTTANFPFSQNYCVFNFDLTNKIEGDAQLTLKNGETALATTPTLHNHDMDLAAMDAASDVSLAFDSPKLNDVDDQATENGVDMKDSGRAFDNFNFQLPPVLPFTISIERQEDYYIVRGWMEKNFLPGGRIMDNLDKLEKYQYFDEQFQACMDAVNTAQPADDDFFDDIPRWPSAFLGIRGYVSGIAHYDPETGDFNINFLDGGITFEASAAAQASVSFGIGSFGMSIDAKMALTMGLVNTNAQMGNVAKAQIDFMVDYQARLKVCAWAYAGIDLWIAKAVCGVRGGACFDLRFKTLARKGLYGMKTTLQAKMEAYAEARFLFWSTKKTWPIFNVKKEYLVPDSPTNPFHEANEQPMFEISRRNVTKSYKKLKRRAVAKLPGTNIISGINGMARPTYLLGGESLLFNNLNTPTDYNDDRIQLLSGSDKSDLVDTGIDAPMYDFAEAHNNSGLELVAFEQIKETINDTKLDAMSENDQTKSVTEKSQIHVAIRQNGAEWATETVGSYDGNIGCVTPAVAVQADGKAAVIWQQGIAKFNEQGTRYIDGSLMLSRYNGSSWSKPIEIKRLHRRSVPADYQMSMKNDSILVMMILQQDVEDEMKQASVVYVYIDGNNRVRERYTQVEGVNPQMVNVNGANLVGYIKTNESGRDVVLSTVDMKGEPTGKLSGSLGMEKRTVNDFRFVVEDDAIDLEDVGLLWSQSDQESTDNGDGTMTVDMKNRVYASKLCSHEKMLYFSTPVEVATLTDKLSLASMDGYLVDRNMKVAYCVTNEQDGGVVMENVVEFDNDIDHKARFNAYEVKNDTLVPITITVANNGFQPIGSIDVTMNGVTKSHGVLVMPQETTELIAYYQVDDDFDGTVDYDLSANFIPGNSNALKMKRRGANYKAPRCVVSRSDTQLDVRQVDMVLKILSKKTDANGVTTIVAEVNNASLLPLASNMKVKVGLYNSPVVDENAVSFAEVTVKASDLYDASAEQKNKVKIVTLTVTQPDVSKVLYLRTTPMQDGVVVKDVRPSNNVLPVSLMGKFKLGDTNHDTLVNMTDAQNVVNTILGKPTTGTFYKENADVSREGDITISDAVGIVNIILNDKNGSAKAKPHPQPLSRGRGE